MYKQLLAIALVLGIALGFQFGCGSSSGGSPPGLSHSQTNGTVAVYGGDVPACGIISFDMAFSGITLTPAAGGTPISLLPSGQSLTVDFASLMDANGPIALASVATGSYSQLNLTLSGAQLTYWDPVKGATTLSLNLPSLSLPLSLSPPVTVSSTSPAALALDFNILNSVLVDQNQQITGNVQPQFTLTAATLGTNSTFAEIEDLRGIVNSVTTASTESAYAGSLLLAPATGPSLTVYVSSSTQYAGVSNLNGLTAGTYVQMTAVLDSSGNLVASQIQAEDTESAANGEAAFRGVITAVTRDYSGNATQFNLLVSEEAPDLHTQVPLESILTFSVSPSTEFAVTAQAKAATFPNFPLVPQTFGPQQLGLGQTVIAHGQVPTSGTAPVMAQTRAIYLGTQPLLGSLSTNPGTPLVVGTDGKTGGFGLVPCSALFPPVTAMTSLQTTFVGSGLSNLDSLQAPGTHSLLVKGLLLFQPAPGFSNNLQWEPATSLQLATEVRQLP